MSKEPFHGSSDFLGAFGYLERDGGVLLVANNRVIEGREQLVWDLPGGRVEPGETILEALRREWLEECALPVEVGEMLFMAEGERVQQGRRTGVWRSFFFRVESEGAIDITAEPDILEYRFAPRSELKPLLHAPYHRGFLEWLATGAPYVADRWED
ncbi:MAG: NUDIX hydrolase [Planctomycetota bacterium]|jgi:ADP-ribose pyrophosphatase YjhB (NUDIX family)